MTKKEVTQLSYEIIGLAIKVHKELGPGLLESVYEQCLKYELEQNGYDVKQQLMVKIDYGKLQLDSNLRIDYLIWKRRKTLSLRNGKKNIWFIFYLLKISKNQFIMISKLDLLLT